MDILDNIKRERTKILEKLMELTEVRNKLVDEVMSMEHFNIRMAASMLNDAIKINDEMHKLVEMMSLLISLLEDE